MCARHSSPWLALAVVAATIGCAKQHSRSPARSSPAAPSTSTRPTLSALVRDSSFVRMESPASGLGPVVEHRASDFHVVSFGEHAALARRKGQVFALDEALGVVGPLALPSDTVWVGLANGDRVFAANRAGTLYTAASLRRALERFDTLNVLSTGLGRGLDDGVAPDALGWDSAGPFIVAVLDATAFVSRDGGVTFDTSIPDAGLRLRRVFVRSDGVIAVMGETALHRRVAAEYHRSLAERWRKGDRSAFTVTLEHDAQQLVTLVSTDGGRHFAKPRFQPRSIERSGAWITGESSAASSDGAARVLGKDGTWLEGLAMPGRASFLDWLGWSSRLDAHRRSAHLTANDPPLPVSAKVGSTEQRGRMITLAEESGDGRDPTCSGAYCLLGVAGREPSPSRWEYGLLSDGECEMGDGDRCPSDAPLTRAPSVAAYDRARDALTVVKVPDHCTPHRIATAADFGVLVCAKGTQTIVYLKSPEEGWQTAGSLDVNVTTLAAVDTANDGGILLQGTCALGAECTAWMRPPDLHASRWRKIVVRDAIAYRVAPRGAVLAIVPVAGGKRFDVVADVPGTEERPIVVHSVPLPGRLRQLGVEASRLFAWLEMPGNPEAPFFVGDEGTLSAVGSGAP